MSSIKFKFPKSIEKNKIFEYKITEQELQGLKVQVEKLNSPNLQAMRKKVIVFIEENQLSPEACG